MPDSSVRRLVALPPPVTPRAGAGRGSRRASFPCFSNGLRVRCSIMKCGPRSSPPPEIGGGSPPTELARTLRSSANHTPPAGVRPGTGRANVLRLRRCALQPPPIVTPRTRASPPPLLQSLRSLGGACQPATSNSPPLGCASLRGPGLKGPGTLPRSG